MNRTTSVFLATLLVGSAFDAQRPYVIVGTGQTHCYDNRGEITPPKPGQPFYGQDAQRPGPLPAYKGNGDGTVSDLNTGLTWVKSRGEKMTWDDAIAGAPKCRVGGFSDWRMPSIKELYSLINFEGGCAGTVENSKPYLDTRFFDFVYGDESKGVRIIDCQDWSATPYVGKTMTGNPTVFGVNFADGRIKGYPKVRPGGEPGRMYARYVRGNPAYGKNDFKDNGDGTVTDRASGLTWTKADSGKGLNWKEALAFAQAQNKKSFLGRNDWRVPNIKELQSLVDYSRSPDATDSAAIDPVFECTRITDEAGTGDYPFYWSSTTHAGQRGGGAAMYVAFGRAAGWMSSNGGAKGPPEGRGPMIEDGGQRADGSYEFVDVHGAGAQRSDPKAGDASDFPRGRGPQGDVIRIKNFVRLVRG